MLGCKDEALFPDGAAFNIVDIVDFVKDNIRDILQPFNVIKNSIAENLRGHQ